MPLSWNPWVTCSHAERGASIGVCTVPLTTSRWRWSLSERPQSFERSKGSIGELKKNSPTLFIAFDSVYETR